MIKKEKVKIMTRLAIYEQNEGKEDLKNNEYFKSDYVSYQNFKIRLSVTIALLILFAGHFAMVFMSNLYQIEQIDYVKYGMAYLIIWLATMVGYTILGTMIHRKKYAKSKRRLDQYKTLLTRLEKYK